MHKQIRVRMPLDVAASPACRPAHTAVVVLPCRLLSRATTVQQRLYRDAYGCSRRGGGGAEAALDQVQQVVGLLESKR